MSSHGELTFAYRLPCFRNYFILAKDSEQDIFILAEYSKFQITLTTIYICNYNNELDMLFTCKTCISFIRYKTRFSDLKSKNVKDRQAFTKASPHT